MRGFSGSTPRRSYFVRREPIAAGRFAPSRGRGWRSLVRDGVRRIWITDTVLSRRRPARAQVVPVAPLLAPVLTRDDD